MEKQILKLLEKVYLRLAGRYGEPVLVGNQSIWGFKGVYEELNDELKKHGLKELSWEEFKEILRFLADKYWDSVYVTFIVSPKGSIEPHDIAFWKPTFLR